MFDWSGSKPIEEGAAALCACELGGREHAADNQWRLKELLHRTHSFDDEE
jgi:hypothetical protein